MVVLAWAALDVRELLHQIDESNTEIAVIAAAVGALHVVAAIVAVRRRRLMT